MILLFCVFVVNKLLWIVSLLFLQFVNFSPKLIWLIDLSYLALSLHAETMKVFQQAQAPGQLTSYGGRMIFLTWFDHPGGKLFFYRRKVQIAVPMYEYQLFSCWKCSWNPCTIRDTRGYSTKGIGILAKDPLGIVCHIHKQGMLVTG